MQTPVFQQLTGLLLFAKTQLRANAQLTGSDSGQYEYTADQVCRATYPHKLFEVQGDGVQPFVKFGEVNTPALAIYVDDSTFQDVDSSSSGTTSPVGMSCALGVQYIFNARARDITNQAFAAHFAFTIWWILCQEIAADFVKDGSSLFGTYHIERLALERCSLLPPFDRSLRAFEANMVMEFKRPPWDTGANSDLIDSTLANIYADINETGEAGAEPLMQMKWTQA